MNRLLLALGALLLLSAAACNKSVDSPTSAEEDLRSGTWVRTSGRVTYKDTTTRGDSTRDYILKEDTCRKDNSITFKEGNVGTINHGTLHCVAAESTKDFTWDISVDEKQLHLYGVADYFPTNNIDAEIVTRTLGYLTLRYKVINVDPLHQTRDTLIYTDILRR